MISFCMLCSLKNLLRVFTERERSIETESELVGVVVGLGYISVLLALNYRKYHQRNYI